MCRLKLWTDWPMTYVIQWLLITGQGCIGCKNLINCYYWNLLKISFSFCDCSRTYWSAQKGWANMEDELGSSSHSCGCFVQTMDCVPALFPTCQVRVVRFYVSCLLLRLLCLLLFSSSPLSDLNHDHRYHPRPVFPAGPQPRPSTRSVPFRTSGRNVR